MISIYSTESNKQGFTLLEVLVTMVVASILGVILLQFMGTSMRRSYEPVRMVQNGFELNQIMEKMNADYKNLLLNSDTPLESLKTAIDNDTYGTYSVVYNNFIIFNNGSEQLDDTIIKRTLKVKITNGSQSMTALFAK